MKRYLLLNDAWNNRIIDRTKYALRVEYFINQDDIKAETDNVNDFIDREHDLVKIKIMKDNYVVVEAKDIVGDLFDITNIVAIYKPDKFGNYILVWSEN